MNGLLIRNARVLTLADGPDGPRRGGQLSQLGVLPAADVLIRDGVIVEVRVNAPGLGQNHDHDGEEAAEIIDADGRVLMPAFVDCHTHACWAGDRLDEWERKLQGAGYLELLASGGGIMSTVRAVRRASLEELSSLLLRRLRQMLVNGATTVEVKSGYGLTTRDELKMLRAIHDAANRWPGRVVVTACLGHALDPAAPSRELFIQQVVRETLEEVSREFPGVTIDAYCENGAWSLAECLRLFDRAQELGHPIRVHADQFHSLGMLPAAIERGYTSVDHLEASEAKELERLAQSEVFGVLLPCSGFHLDERYADGRGLVDLGGKLALATNCNPGSAPCASLPMTIALATRRLGLTPAEAITAVTRNAALVLGMADIGRVAPGGRADLVLLRHRDERLLAFEFGDNPVDLVICHGQIVRGE